ncbi:hypothetical protein E3P85_02939 [Wallemia ichthyophaga]|nr:hypothetical protein E3P85_02939 [Wallemia ichthyophaga]
MVPQIVKSVLNQDNLSQLRISNALLFGYTRHHVIGEDYPAITTDSEAILERSLTEEESTVRGALIEGLTDEHISLFDRFEGYEYDRVATKAYRITPKEICSEDWKPSTAKVAGDVIDQVDCEVYVWRDGSERLEKTLWTFDAFVKEKLHKWVKLDYITYNPDNNPDNTPDNNSTNFAFLRDDKRLDSSESGSRAQTPKPRASEFGRDRRQDFFFSDDYGGSHEHGWNSLTTDRSKSESRFVVMMSCVQPPSQPTGSFGAVPKPVMQAYRKIQDKVEANPDLWYVEAEYEAPLNQARRRLSKLVNCDDQDLVFVPNATHGVSEVLANVKFNPEDEIFVFSTSYPSCVNACRSVLDNNPGLRMTIIPLSFPTTHDDIIASFETTLMGSASPKLALIDAISSKPGCRLPWQRLVDVCRKNQVLSLVDAAQEIGHQDVDLKEAQPDFWVSNCHKWLYTQRGCGVMYVSKENQKLFKSSMPTGPFYNAPDVTGSGRGFTFATIHSWSGTMDLTAYLSVNCALDYREQIGGEARINQYCSSLAIQSGKALAELWGTCLLDNDAYELTSNMVNVQLPVDLSQLDPHTNMADLAKSIQHQLMHPSWSSKKYSVSVYHHAFSLWARISAQIYVSYQDVVFDFGRGSTTEKLRCERKDTPAPLSTNPTPHHATPPSEPHAAPWKVTSNCTKAALDIHKRSCSLIGLIIISPGVKGKMVYLSITKRTSAMATKTTTKKAVGSYSRLLATKAPPKAPPKEKEEGSIASVFASLSGDKPVELPQRFSHLKKNMWKDSLIESWRDVLSRLKMEVEHVEALGSDAIPRLPFHQIKSGMDVDKLERIKKVGSVVVDGGVPEGEALRWKQSIRDYARANKDRVRGFPADDVQVFELYHSVAQTEARCHPALRQTQEFLLNLLHASDPQSEISLGSVMSYLDRLRIRKPGDSQFALGPHIDGGSLERWEDPGYRACWKHILQGNWEEHDPFDVSPRLNAQFDLYGAAGGCSVYRPFQGWTSLSKVGPREGTLKVLPVDLKLATAYIILRPFFAPVRTPQHLDFSDWKLDLESTHFPGGSQGRTQELSSHTHPHLQLDKTMVSAPSLSPGDQVYWHSDVVHAVEPEHHGQSDSSVLYIPAIPLTINNAHYLVDQRSRFIKGLPPSDFPGGEGESHFFGRMLPENVEAGPSRQLLGLEPFPRPQGASPARAVWICVSELQIDFHVHVLKCESRFEQYEDGSRLEAHWFMWPAVLRALSVLIEGSGVDVHRVLYPFPWITTLHAARISLAYTAKSQAEYETERESETVSESLRPPKRSHIAAYMGNYLVLAWSGSILIASILQQPYTQLLSPYPLINYVTVHMFLRYLPTPPAQVVDFACPLVDGLLRSGALTGAVLGSARHPNYAHSLFPQLVLGTLAPSAGSLIGGVLGVTRPLGWSLSTPHPLRDGVGWIDTLELWIALLCTVLYGVLTHSHPDYTAISDSPSHTHLGARSVVMLVLTCAYFFKAVVVHARGDNRGRSGTSNKRDGSNGSNKSKAE